MVHVLLDCKIEMPDFGETIADNVSREIDNDLKIISQELSNKIRDMIAIQSQLKIYPNKKGK